MRKIIVALCLTCISVSLSAQQRVIDSLRHLVQTEKRDTTRIKLTARLADTYLSTNADSSLYYAQQVLDFARASNSFRFEIVGLNLAANVFMNLGNYGRALTLFLDAQKICEKHNDLFRVQAILLNIANIYGELGDYRESLSYLQKTLKINEISKREDVLTTIWLNMGDIYEKLNILDSARLYTVIANEEARKTDDEYIAAISNNNLGNIYSKMGETEIALSYYRSALPLIYRNDEFYILCETALGMAKIFQLKGRNDSALYYARLSTSTARDKGFAPVLLKASTFLADYFKKQKNSDSAFVYMETLIAAKDTLFSTEKTNHIQNLILEENSRQQKIEADRLQAKAEREQNIQYGIIAITLLSFAILFLVLSRSIIVSDKWIHFMGILGLLLVFEFVNLIVHPLLADITHHSPIWMLAIMVVIAAVLIPLHHRLEHFIRHRLTAKNKQLRLRAAKKIVAQLEQEEAALKEVE